MARSSLTSGGGFLFLVSLPVAPFMQFQRVLIAFRRDFLLFLPQEATNMRAIYSYYQSTVNVNPEGDAVMSSQTLDSIGYFLAGGNAGAVSRTVTAPFDRLKVYLIARTDSLTAVVTQVKDANPVSTAKKAFGPLRDSITEIYRAGGIWGFFAGNGLNVAKVLPESAIKFGSFEVRRDLQNTIPN